MGKEKDKSRKMRSPKKYLIYTGVIAMLFFTAFPIMVNVLMNLNFGYRVSGDEGEWIPFYASFYGALLGGVVSGTLTLGGVYLTIQHEKQNRISETFPQKRKHAGDVLSYMEELRNFLSSVRDEENEESLNKYTGDFSGRLNEFIHKSNEILNSAAMVNGTFFYNTRKVIAHCKAIEEAERTPALHPYHRVDLDMNQVEYAKIILETIKDLESQSKDIDRKIDELNY